MLRTPSAPDITSSAMRTTTTATTVVETVALTMDAVLGVMTAISTASIQLRSATEVLMSADVGTTMTVTSETSVTQTPMSARPNVLRIQNVLDLIRSVTRTTTTASIAESETAMPHSDVVLDVTTVS